MDCESLAEVQTETPNLRIFKYSGSIISFISDALTLSEADLCFITDDMDTQCYVKYVEVIWTHCEVSGWGMFLLADSSLSYFFPLLDNFL